jgi:glycosyltransferase involved in cell wall biosynthesis
MNKKALITGITGQDGAYLAKLLFEKNKKQLLVSITIISKNSKDVIGKCLDRVLNQTYPNIEVVVVDSSDDGTEKLIEEYSQKSKFPFRIIHQEPRGVGAARNTAIKNASGDVITNVDADVIIPVDFVEKIAEPFNKSDKVMGVQAKDLIKSSSDTIFSSLVMLHENIMSEIPVYKSPGIGIRAVRREFYERTKGYDEDLKSGEDMPYWKKQAKVKKELEELGYLFPIVDTMTIEEKQEQTFKEYWKKCTWYGEPLANMKYIKADIKINLIKIFGATYITSYPFVILIMLISGFQLTYLIVSLIPLIGLVLFMIYRGIERGLITWKLILLPVFVYYKSFWTFVGFMKGII